MFLSLRFSCIGRTRIKKSSSSASIHPPTSAASCCRKGWACRSHELSPSHWPSQALVLGEPGTACSVPAYPVPPRHPPQHLLRDEAGSSAAQGFFCSWPVLFRMGCRENTTFFFAFLSPVGSFLAQRGGQSAQDCQLCLAGWFCSLRGQSSPEGLCKEGWFCPLGSASGRSPGRKVLKRFVFYGMIQKQQEERCSKVTTHIQSSGFAAKRLILCVKMERACRSNT